MSNLGVPRFKTINLRGTGPLPSPKKGSKIGLGPRGRLLAAATLSLTLHGAGAAVVGLIDYLSNLPQPSPIAKTEKEPIEPAEEEPKGITEAERILLLGKFRAEKNAFIQQLLQDLHQGKCIPISDFAIKSEVLDKNIESLESDSKEIEITDEKEIRNRYKTVLRQANKWTGKFKWRRKKIGELHHFSHHQMFRAYFMKSSKIVNILLEGMYNCESSTKFLTALEDDIVSSKSYGVVILDPPKDPSIGRSGHILSWYRGGGKLWQIENTNGGPPRTVPFKKGLRTTKEIFMAAYLVKNGIKVSQLPQKLRRFYKKGIGGGGFPIAGVSHDFPDPPPYPIPNPYYRLETAEIIKEARISVMALSLFQKPETERGKISLSLVKIPKGVDWCNVAEEAYPDGAWGELINRYLPSPAFGSLPRLRYLTALRMAKILSDSGADRFERCTPEAEYRKFLEDVEITLREGGKFDEDQEELSARQLLRGLSNARKARKELFKIINKFGPTRNIGQEALALLAIISSPEDFNFFKGKLIEDVGDEIDHIFLAQFSSYALLNMNLETKEIARIFFSAIETEKNRILRRYFITRLGKLGYGIEALKLMEKELSPGLIKEYEDPLEIKHRITGDISKLHPYTVTSKDIQNLRSMIEQEKDLYTKINLIAILANEGKKEEALGYFKELDLSGLDDYFERIEPEFDFSRTQLREDFVYALGKINFPGTREVLISMLDAHPELALLVGVIFVRQSFRSERIIDELRRILNDKSKKNSKRMYAAVLLIQMGAL